MTRDEEKNLIQRVLAGETELFETLVKAHERAVYDLALRMLGSEQDALDAAQEAFFRAWRALGSFRGDSKFSVWLYRLTSNVCLDMLRRASRREESSLTDEEGEDLELPDRRFDPQTEPRCGRDWPGWSPPSVRRSSCGTSTALHTTRSPRPPAWSPAL